LGRGQSVSGLELRLRVLGGDMDHEDLPSAPILNSGPEWRGLRVGGTGHGSGLAICISS